MWSILVIILALFGGFLIDPRDPFWRMEEGVGEDEGDRDGD